MNKPTSKSCMILSDLYWGLFSWYSISFHTSGLPAHTFIERYVTVGASSLLRSCTIEPECIVGQHSILMEGSLMETHSILEAGSVLPPGRRIPTGELWAGNPARFVRTLTHEETLEIPKLAVAINDLSTSHFSEFLPYSTAYLEVEKLKKSFGISIWWSLIPCSVSFSLFLFSLKGNNQSLQRLVKSFGGPCLFIWFWSPAEELDYTGV